MRRYKKKLAILMLALVVACVSVIQTANVQASVNKQESNVQARAVLRAVGSKIYVMGVNNDIWIYKVKVSDGSELDVWNMYDKHTYVGYNYTTYGTEVGTLQASLNGLGYNLDVDFRFGPNTHAALIDFQRKSGLSIDATAGPNTWRALNSRLPVFK